ncbi:MAG: DUF1206 domain-containing protein [Actinomycetota bacterium]|nr:DUF1206 domain-containing protein [Actinomycetota bacterium]
MNASATESVRRAAHSDKMEGLARFGLGARGAVYVLIGVLALFVAFGKKSKETDQRGALQALSQQTGGFVLLLILGLGLAGYAIWRFSEAAFGVVGEGTKAGPRVQSLGRGLIYTFLAVSAFTILISGRDSSQAKDQQSLTARTMQHTAGRWLVGLVGVAVVIAGLVLVYEGVTRKFEEQLKLGEMSARARKVTEFLGTVGTAARGVVFGMAGILVITAAVQYEPKKARGIDGALRALRDTAVGPWLLVVVAIGLVMFGLFGFCEARWRRT